MLNHGMLPTGPPQGRPLLFWDVASRLCTPGTGSSNDPVAIAVLVIGIGIVLPAAPSI